MGSPAGRDGNLAPVSMAGAVRERDEPLTLAQKVARVAIAASVLVVGGVWILAIFIVEKGPRDLFDDRAWAQQADAVCSRWMARIDGLPPARSFADVQPRSVAISQRADVGEEATDLLESMVAELRTLRSADAATTQLTDLWLGEYETYIDFRRQHIVKWRNGEDPRFVEPAVQGEPLSRGMDGFAEANGMSACEVPGDFG
jgi:hypothetical protein